MSNDRRTEVDQHHDLSLDDLNNPMYGLSQRRRLGTIAVATAAATLATLGVGMIINKSQETIQNHKIAPTTLEVGKLNLKDNAKLFVNTEGQAIQIPWDEVTVRGIHLKDYQNVGVANALIREIPKPNDPYYADVILKDAQLTDGEITDVRVAYDDPNLGHSLVKGFADVGSFHTTPNGEYTATYQGKPITPDQVFIVTPGQPKK